LPKKPDSKDPPNDIPARIQELLGRLSQALPEEKERVREEVRLLASAMSALRRFSRHRLSKVVTAKASRRRILEYLTLFLGEVVDGDELEIVSGIHEYPRRVRELRVQEGYRITTGVTREDLRPDQYVLESAVADQEEADRWKTANKIRRMPGAGKTRMLELLKAFLGRPVTGEQLLYVAKVKDMRRARELRTDDGWRITTRFTGRPELAPNVYVLEGTDQLPPHDRKIEPDVYDAVLARDKYSCRKCGWNTTARRFDEKRQFVELHHIEHHKDKGQNNPENLITLCNVHHDAAHKLKVGPQDFFEWVGAR
jgi:hypothetical protein